MVALALLALSLLTSSAQSQNENAQHRAEPSHSPGVIDFEDASISQLPPGWSGGPAGTLHSDNQIAHSGKWSVRLERGTGSPGEFSALTAHIPIYFAGNQIVLRGYLRIENVEQFAGLWVREDGDEGKMISLENMQGQNLRGTREWAEYSVTLPLDPKARTLYFGALLAGTGKVWVDDLQLLVDGKPAVTASERARTVLDRDHQFDGGSGIELAQLSATQVENLVTLGRVWGFLKYHHPAVTSGDRQWDYELFRILPAVLAAKSQDGANAEMVAWIDGLGSANQGGSHAPIGKDGLEFGPDLAWMKDTNSLGEALSERLEAVYANRPVGEQFYISLAPGVGNPVFDHELFYPKISFPDAGFQLLALYRFWNIMQYWSPNRLVADENWPEVLREFVPRAMLAKNKDEYQLAMMAFAAKVNDTHTNLWSSLKVRPPVGDCRLPVNLRFVEGKLVVTGFASDNLGPASGLKRGDVIEQIDGRSIEDLTKEWTPLYADSNEAARLRDMARAMTNGGCGPTRIAVLRSGLDSNQGSDGSVTVEAERGPIASMEAISRTDDLPGPTFRLLSKDVAYLKLSSIKAADVPKYIEQARGTKGLVIDIRNYPSEFVVFALGNLLVDHETPFARFTTADLANPGAFYWRDRTALNPAQPHYSGKIVILVDEVSLSQAEYMAMAFRSAPNGIVVGSMTAGADGNVSKVPLPGDVTSAISGIGVFYPDERPTQRVGIIPDVKAQPTITGIRAGRDEVLETGIRQILGKEVSLSDIQKLIAR